MLATHRQDPGIQGLRAVAVSLVLLFHVLPYIFSGGYIGVDVFFVISGFVITRLILRDHSNNRFSFADFYTRRFLRLAPPLLLTCLVSLLVAWFVLLPDEFSTLATTSISALLYLSNWYFASEAGYFSEQLETNPLLHTWSLGVEEQFYLLFPLLLIWLLRRRQQLFVSLVMLTAVLYAMAYSWTLLDPDSAFFASPLRFFQFTAGACMVFVCGKHRLHPWLADGLGAASMSALLLALLVMNKTTAFPGVAALVPTLATMLLLWVVTQPDNWVGRLLSIRPAVWLGNISYSVYLWHWPLIIYCKLAYTAAFSLPVVGVLLASSIVLGFISWRFVEQPCRRIAPSQRSRALATIVLSTLGLLALSGWIIAQQGLASRFDPAQVALAGYMKKQNRHYGQGQCFITQANTQWQSLSTEPCLPQSEHPRTLLLLGDSHAAHLNQALRDKFNDIRVGQVTAAGCKPLLSSTSSLTGRCAEIVRSTFDKVVKQPTYRAVILAARWQQSDIPALRETLHLLKKQHVIVIGPGLDFKLAVPRLLIFNQDKPDKVASQSNIASLRVVDLALAELVKAEGGQYYSMLEQQCTPDCRYIDDNGVPIQWDTSHLTRQGADFMLRNLQID